VGDVQPTTKSPWCACCSFLQIKQSNKKQQSNRKVALGTETVDKGAMHDGLLECDGQT
jgi:hypothetical protein